MLLVAVPLGISWYLAKHRTLQVVNGFVVPVTFHVDNQPEATVGPLGRQEVSLAEGSHHATYKIGDLPPQEVDFKVSDGFFARFGNSQVPILDPGGGAVLVREQTEYTERGDSGNLPYTILVGNDFMTSESVDFLFEPFPPTMQIEQGQRLKKAALHRLEVAPAKVLAGLANVPVDARLHWLHAESALRRVTPDDQDLIFEYIGLAATNHQAERCRDFLAAGLSVRPVHIEWHRGYQYLQTSEADGEKLRDQYSAMLAKEPKNSALLYLRGRLETDPERSLDYFRRAIAADPTNPYPQFATSYQLLLAGDFAAAASSAAEAIRLAPKNEQMQMQSFLARIAVGDYTALETELRQQKTLEPQSLILQLRLLQVLTAAGKAAEAVEAQAVFETRLRSSNSDPQAASALEISHLLLLYHRQQFSEMLQQAVAAAPSSATKMAQFYANLELGHLDDAATVLTNLGDESIADEALVLSIAYRAKKDAKHAAQWQAKARNGFYAGSKENRTEARLLDALPQVDLSVAKFVMIDPSNKTILLLALAQQSPSERAELLKLAKKLNFERTAPYYFLQRTIAATETANDTK